MVAVPMSERVDHRWTVGPYTFEGVSRHGFPEPKYPPVMYRYKIDGERVDSELYASLDRALVAAVGARHMGPRGASGNAVGTAADWFCIMIGLAEAEREEQPAEPEHGSAPIADRCLGSGRGWMAVRDSDHPACPRCGATPGALGVAKPERRGLGYLGHVPEHGLR